MEDNLIRHTLIQLSCDTVNLSKTVFLADQLLLHDLTHTHVALVDITDIHDLP